ncbi:MAG: glycoside hydrolase family 3 N-terminal domain-containing protein [Bacillota bacterium]|nr:glycoside hydrolase family 3 N-terminal domain-containing protein [Bacillota bacterium]
MQQAKKVQARVKKILEVDGLNFVDLNGNGVLDPYEDWRLPIEERIEDLIGRMSIDEKIGLMFIRSMPTGFSQKDKSLTSHGGALDEETKTADSIFAYARTPGASEMIQELGLRHFIYRENQTAEDTATWANALNEVCEASRLGIPCIIASNSRNEKGDAVFGMNDAAGMFTTFPGTLGLAAAAQGDKKRGQDPRKRFARFAEIARREWCASGLRKGYMYMVDVVTDPRWQRIYGTFGEDVELICDITPTLIEGFQGQNLNEKSVALTIKHFPGGGARENGFDPHYEEGKFNAYATENSLIDYHLPPFEAAMKTQPASIMPYYSIPSAEHSAKQVYKGKELKFEPYGFAFNSPFLQDMLRDSMGFEGYINSDSGIINKMCWGVEDLEVHERAARAVNAGVDVISDSHEVTALRRAFDEGLVDEERLNLSARRLLRELFLLGLFDDARYVDASTAAAKVKTKDAVSFARQTHEESLTLLKNSGGRLPIRDAAAKKFYIEGFAKKDAAAAELNQALKALARDDFRLNLVDTPEEADVVLAFLRPQSGDYFNATPGLLELDLVEKATRIALDGSEYQETTLLDADRLQSMLREARAAGKTTVVSVNFTLPWILERIEPYANVLIASFDAFEEAQLKLILGQIEAWGALPITLPASGKVIEVTDGVSISPNDVPGYDKQQYMPADLIYAYVDEDGNKYELGFGL